MQSRANRGLNRHILIFDKTAVFGKSSITAFNLIMIVFSRHQEPTADDVDVSQMTKAKYCFRVLCENPEVIV